MEFHWKYSLKATKKSELTAEKLLTLVERYNEEKKSRFI